MKVFIFSLLLLSIYALPSFEQFAPIDFVKGLYRGLHLEGLTGNISGCETSINNTLKAYKDFIQALEKNQTVYELINKATIGLGIIPKVSRFCYSTPGGLWEGIKKIYNEYDSSFANYILAVMVNAIANPDVIIYNVMQAKRQLEFQQFYHAGFSIGTVTNFVLNVTKNKPPPPPPSTKPIQVESSIDWDNIFNKIRIITNYTLTCLKYSKIINDTTFRNLNNSLIQIESKAYNAFLKFKKKEWAEGILLTVDTLEYLNMLWKGLFFTFLQVPDSLSNTIFKYPLYIGVHYILHSSYIGWTIWNAYKELMDGDGVTAAKKISILVNKALFFDDFTLEEIKLKTPVQELLNRMGYKTQ